MRGKAMAAVSKDLSTGTLARRRGVLRGDLWPGGAPSNRDKYGPKPSVQPPLKPF